MSWQSTFQSSLKGSAYKALTGSQIALYFGESLPLPLIYRLINGQMPEQHPEPQKFFQDIRTQIELLVDQDQYLFTEGLMPLSDLLPRSPSRHATRYLKVMADSFRVALRRAKRKHNDIPAVDPIDSLPEYYLRNFHFQTDGYLSDFSAEIYDHQVDLLFRGTTDMMRRLGFAQIFSETRGITQGRAIDVAAGTGRSTNLLSQLLPHFVVTGLDASRPYIQAALADPRQQKNIEYLVGLAENLPFKDQHFDLWTSTYLFHELPKDLRTQVIAEAVRVLKPSGLFVLRDSLQLGDTPSLDWALHQFPKTFHEPFYTNYIKDDLAKTLNDHGLTVISTHYGFLTKAIVARKN